MVILVHTAQFYPNNIDNLSSTVPLIYVSIGRIGVPLFFMLSGALLLNREYTLSDFYIKRISRILIPAIFWIFITLVFYDFNSLLDLNFILIWIYNLEFRWFVCAILGVYLVIPIFNSFIKEHGMNGIEYFLAIWIIFMIFLNFNVSPDSYIMYLFANFGQYIGFAVLGYYLANKNFNIYAAPMIIFNLIIFIAGLLANIYLVNTYTIVIPYKSLILITECSALFLIFRYTDKLSIYKPENPLSKAHNFIKNSIIAKIIYTISICSYTLYLMHNFPSYFIKSQIITVQSVNLIPVVFILSAILSVIIAAILSHIPKLNRICGVDK